MTALLRYPIAGGGASAIAASVEAGIRDGLVPAGALLPAVRALAERLRVSPATVAAAYKSLARRGLVTGQGRRGTRVALRPALGTPASPPPPPGLRNLADGNPDPALLPGLRQALARVDARPRLYGGERNRADLLALARRQFEADRVPAAALAVVGGAMDGVERVLQAHLRPGDRVAVEDPGYTGVLDLLGALALVPEPMAMDDFGPRLEDFAAALGRGVKAVVVTPRAQNPLGAAFDERRALALGRLLDAHPGVLLIEDDHAGPVAGAAALTLAHARRKHWAHVRSVSKWLGPDLRVALLAGDAVTIARVEGRQQIGSGWVSHVVQAITAALWSGRASGTRLRNAAGAYAERRQALIRALAHHGIVGQGRSGMNVWIPVPEEQALVQGLAAAGWFVRAGERYRLKSPPALRITISDLRASEAGRFAADLAGLLGSSRLTRTA